MFGAGASGMINPPDPSRYYSISVAEVAVFDRDVYNLLMDLNIIYDMAKVCMCVLRLDMYFFISFPALVVCYGNIGGWTLYVIMYHFSFLSL